MDTLLDINESFRRTCVDFIGENLALFHLEDSLKNPAIVADLEGDWLSVFEVENPGEWPELKPLSGQPSATEGQTDHPLFDRAPRTTYA